MAVKTVFINTQDGFHNKVFIVGDGSKFLLNCNGLKTHVITTEEATELVKAVTGFNTALITEKLKVGRKLSNESQIITVLMNAKLEDDPTYTIFRIKISTSPLATWAATIFMQNQVIDLPNGCIDDIVKYLNANGVAKASTYGAYDKIVFVDKLPDATTVTDDRVVYVLNKKDGDKDVDSAWTSNKTDWVEFKDVE